MTGKLTDKALLKLAEESLNNPLLDLSWLPADEKNKLEDIKTYLEDLHNYSKQVLKLAIYANSYRKLLKVNNYKQNIQTITAKQEYSNLEHYIGNYALDLSALYKTFKSDEIPSPKDVHYNVILKNFPPDVIEHMQIGKNVILKTIYAKYDEDLFKRIGKKIGPDLAGTFAVLEASDEICPDINKHRSDFINSKEVRNV